MKHEESKLQSSFVTWFKLQYPKYWMFSVPNSGNIGGKKITSKKTGKQIPLEAIFKKREGMKAGTSDLILLYANKDYHALCIETKIEKEKQSDKQIEFELYCKNNGYKYVVCRSLDEFMNAINTYLF